MKKTVFSILLTSFAAFVVIFYFNRDFLKEFTNLSKTSPSALVASAKTSNPFWNPSYLDNPPAIPPPVVDSKAALVAELTTAKILFTKNPDLRLPIGSIQKIVTAMVALDHLQESDIVTISQNASLREPDSMGLYPGEKLTLKQLLYGMILVSGNDAATAIAEAVSGDENKFATVMTQKAKTLGLENSLFINSNGLDEGVQYSTVSDLATLAQDLITNYPQLAKIVATKQLTIPNTINETENHKEYYLVNTSPVVDLPGYLGIKPGYTPSAGRCLLTLVQKDNKKYLIITLGGNDRKGDTEALLNYGTQIYP